MPTRLRLRPSYRHAHDLPVGRQYNSKDRIQSYYGTKKLVRPGLRRSKLTADDERTMRCFQKLRPYLAIKKEPECPAWGWTYVNAKGVYYSQGGNIPVGDRSLFQSNGFHYPVRWMPVLRDEWRRLNFDEFCAYYDIPPFNDKAKAKAK